MYTVSTIDAQGKVARAWTLLESAYGRGFVSASQKHALAYAYDASDRAIRCAVTLYDFQIR